MNNNYLIHAGVKGMKWGVRKKQEPTGDNRSGSKKSNIESSSQTPKQKSKGKTVAKVLGITAGATAVAALVTAGAVIAAKAIKKHGGTKVSVLKDNDPRLLGFSKPVGLLPGPSTGSNPNWVYKTPKGIKDPTSNVSSNMIFKTAIRRPKFRKV